MKPAKIFVFIVFTLLVVNFWWAHRTGYPFLVCWFGASVYPLVTSWLTFIAVVAVGYLIGSFFVRSHFYRALVLVLLLMLLPDVASALLMGGGSCEGFANHIPAESKRHIRLFPFRAKVAEVLK